MMRQILKTFGNSVIKTKPVQYKFATESKNVFVLPRKQLIHPAALNETFAAIGEAYTVRMLSYLFRVRLF